MRPRRPPIGPLPDPADVLAGRTAADAGDLVRLIHAVNPTDRGLSQAETERRYVLKSALQSLLLRRFPEAVRAVADPHDDDLVSLRLVHGTGDAGHARVSRLDPDARQRIWTASPGLPTIPTPPPSPRSSPTDPLARGVAALEAWDYEEARACFEAALPAPEAARRLVDLLVNHVGLDGDALALVPRLGSATSTAEVAANLALAAARTGDMGEASRWLALAPTAVDALLLVAVHHLDRGDVQASSRTVSHLRERDPAHPSLPELDHRLSRLRRVGQDEDEAALAPIVASGDDEAIEARAREVLARWPGSEAARAALQRVSDHQAESALQSALLAVRSTLEAGDVDGAEIARQRACVLAERNRIRGRFDIEISQLRSLVRVARARVTLAGGDLDAGLHAWDALDPEERALLPTPTHPAFGWFHGLPARAGRAAAVLALWEAGCCLEEHRIDAAASRLESIPTPFLAHAEARRLLASLHAARVARAGTRLDEVLRAQEGLADPEARLALLVDVKREDLDPARAARLHALQEELEAQAAKSRLVGRLDALVAAADLLAARDLAGRHPPLHDRLADVEGRIRRAWRVEVLEGVDLDIHDVTPSTTRQPCPWLLSDASAFVQPTVLQDWLFLRLVGMEDLRVRRSLALRLPEPCVGFAYALVDQDNVTVLDAYGHLVTVSLRTGLPTRWLRRPPDFPSPPLHQEVAAVLAPGGRYAWYAIRREGKLLSFVYDTEAWSTRRPLDQVGIPAPLHGCNDAEMILLGEEGSAWTYRPNGRRADKNGTWYPEDRPTRAAPDPRGRALVATLDAAHRTMRSVEHDATLAARVPRDGGLAIAHPNVDREESSIKLFADRSVNSPHTIATSLDQGFTVILYGAHGFLGADHVVRDSTGEMSLTEHRSHVPSNTCLLIDSASRHVRAIAPSADGVRVVRVDPDLPAYPFEEVQVGRVLHTWSPSRGLDHKVGGCGWAIGRDTPSVVALRKLLQDGPATGFPARLTAWRTAHADDPEGLLDVLTLYVQAGLSDEAQRVWEEVEQHTELAAVRCTRAHAEVEGRYWDDAWDTLSPPLPGAKDPEVRQHLLHLKVLTALHTGRRDEAAATLREAAAVQGGSCDLGPLRSLLAALDGAPEPTAVTGQQEIDRIGLCRLVGAILEADAAVARGDPGQAIAVLDPSFVWRAREVQSAARRASAWFDVEATDPTRRWRKRLALATYLDVRWWVVNGDANTLPIPPRTWSEERLAEVESRTRRWLDEAG